MAIRKNQPGKVISQLQGYRIRQLIKGEYGQKVPTGKFGVYAGKKLVSDELNSKKEAIKFLNNIAGRY